MNAHKRRVGIISGAVLAATLGAFGLYQTTTPDESAPATAGPQTSVSVGTDLQAVLNAAACGATLNLEAGATYTGPITLPVKPCTDLMPLTIQSSRAAELPVGVRVRPEQSPLMARIVSPGQGQPAIRTEAGAHHYRLIGLEVAPVDRTAFVYDLVLLGDGGSEQNTLEKVPHHLTLDRCYIHAYPQQSLKRGIALNSASTDILNSFISGFKVVGQDTQAIMGWNGPAHIRLSTTIWKRRARTSCSAGLTLVSPDSFPPISSSSATT